jgi:hypothetical protein
VRLKGSYIQLSKNLRWMAKTLRTA